MKTSHTFKSYVISLAVALSIPVSGFCEKSFEHTVSFDISEFSTDTVTCDSSKYISIRYGSMSNGSGQVGDPALPVKIVSLSVPLNTTGFKVEVVSKNGGVTRPLPYSVEPIAQPKTTGVSLDSLFVQPGIPAPLPLPKEYLVTPVVTNEDYADGCNHIVTVALAPLDYKTTSFSKRVTLYENIVLRVSYEECSAEQLAVKPLVPEVMQSQAYVKTLVDNPYSVRINSPAPNTDNADIKRLPYFIITSEKLKESFKDLALWKREKGYKVKIITMDSIYASPYVTNGDTITGINDEAGKLRAYLMHLFKEYGRSFVLLGGDYTQVPIRYSKYGRRFFPCDWYFSELNSNWDYNQNGILGEVADDYIGMEPELILSRLICFEKYQVKQYIDKLIRYEANPGNGDPSYLGKMFSSLQKDWFSVVVNKDDIPQNMGLEETKVLEDLENQPYPTGSDIINMLNENHYGFISFNGHGAPNMIETTRCIVEEGVEETFGINAHSSHKEWKPADPRHNSHNYHLDRLKNTDHPAIGYSTSCSTCPFDRMEGFFDDGKQPTMGTFCFGSSFTCGWRYGGPAFISNTREGYVVSSSELFNVFSRQLTLYDHIGICQDNARRIYAKGDNGPERKKYVALVNHEVGEPEFDVWLGVPQINNFLISSFNGRTVLFGSNFKNSHMVISDRTQLLNKLCEENTIDVSNYTNKCISFWRKNHLPNIIFIGNGSLSDNSYSTYYVTHAFLGVDKDSEFSVQRKNLTFQVFRGISGKNFNIANQSNVNLSCPKEINLDGVKISSESVLNVVGSEMVIDKIEVDNTSELTIEIYE